MKIPESHEDIFYGKNFAHVATINPDNTPQVTPVWVDFDKESQEVLINTAEGRKKVRNLRNDPHIALSVQDMENPYRYIEVQGEVLEITNKGARDHINKMAQKYMNKKEYPKYEGEVRLLIRIKPIYVHTMG